MKKSFVFQWRRTAYNHPIVVLFALGLIKDCLTQCCWAKIILTLLKSFKPVTSKYLAVVTLKTAQLFRIVPFSLSLSYRLLKLSLTDFKKLRFFFILLNKARYYNKYINQPLKLRLFQIFWKIVRCNRLKVMTLLDKCLMDIYCLEVLNETKQNFFITVSNKVIKYLSLIKHLIYLVKLKPEI